MRKSSIVILLSLLPLLLAGLSLPAQGAPQEPLVSNARLETLSAAAGLRAALQQAGARNGEAFWAGYSVPMTAGQGRICCYDKGRSTTCYLASHSQGWGMRDRDQPVPDPRLKVFLRFAAGKLAEVRTFSEDCTLDAGDGRFVSLGNVKPEESVAYLAEVARTSQGDPGTEAVFALAMHRNANAESALEDLVSAPGVSRKTREDAVFFIGATRGESGARFVAGVLRDESADDEIRKKAMLSLSTSGTPAGAETIARVGREDPNREIRGEALFFLAHMDAPEAPDTILKAVKDDPDLSVRKQAVFALSQLPKGKAVPYLIRAGKETDDREIRKEAFFWLSQSEDPAASEYLERAFNQN